MIQKIIHNDTLLALIIPGDFNESGIHFFTPDEFSQQLAYMHHPKGKVIQPHVHKPLSREVVLTQEVLFIKSGILRVDFYSDDQKYLESRVLHEGDVILLAGGGHGFEAIEPVEMIEVKQGPYSGESEKTRFTGTPREKIRLPDEK
jgi:mannose-6-phosphate isomerase-like protein (cupin superfamily)